jgi:hypothetical protein
MEIAREEYRQIVSRSRFRVALQRKPPHTANYRFIHKQPVYVYRENERHWTGPHLVVSSHAKQVFVDLGERTGPRSFTSETSRNTLDIGAAVLPTPTTNVCSLVNSPSASLPLISHLNAPRLMFKEVLSPRDHRIGLFDDERILTAYSIAGLSS